MRHIYVFLALRLLRRQRLRTVSIFCGMLFSVYLLCAFAGFGYEFWRQVHSGADENTRFDATEKILILLVAVVLLLVVSCAVVLLGNLFSLTYSQRRKSLSCLVSLGADVKGLFVVTFLDTALLFCAAAFAGLALARLTVKCVGVSYELPLWIYAAVFAVLFWISCWCAGKPLSCVWRSSSILCTGRKKQRLRVAVTLLAAILLYVPADYVIGTNFAVHRSEMNLRYGISYSANPQDGSELAKALDECRKLAEAMNQCGQPAAGSADGDCLSYVLLPVSAEVKTDAMSGALRNVLKKADWEEQPYFSAEAEICFLEDEAYKAYVRSCGGEEAVSSVLVNRYVNRAVWSGQAKPSFRETEVLGQADGGDKSAVAFFYRFDDGFLPVSTSRMTPELIAKALPEGLDFDGSLTLIVPLSRLEAVCADGADIRRMQVCGKFADAGQHVFPALEACLGAHAAGSLRNTREVFREWYASMHGLHLAMRAISGLLFFMAVLNLSGMMVFQYMQQRRGLAIRWSLGESPRGLLIFLIREHLQGFCGALVIGVAVSAVLCRVIYGIFQSVWRIDFVFPGRQVGVVMAMALLVSLAAVSVDGYFIRHQRFLEDIRRAEWE